MKFMETGLESFFSAKGTLLIFFRIFFGTLAAVSGADAMAQSGAAAPLPAAAGETVWMDDALPAGASVPLFQNAWRIQSTTPAPFSGALAVPSDSAIGQVLYFMGATATLTPQHGDRLFAYVYLDPSNPPSEIMIQWNDGSWDHRAYWGVNQLIMGADGTESRRPMGPLPAPGQWVRLEVPASDVGLEGRAINGLAFTVFNGRATWDRAGLSAFSIAPAAPPSEAVVAAVDETVWFDDEVPAGATVAHVNDAWRLGSTTPAAFSGISAVQSNVASGTHVQYFFSATNTMNVRSGDTLFAYVYLDPANLPSEIMLQWNDGTWEHRAYWGANEVNWGTNGTDSRRYVGALPAAGQWVRLEVPASQVGLAGRTVSGLAFTLYNGRATWDRAGRVSTSSSIPNPITTTPNPSATPTPAPDSGASSSGDLVWFDDAVPTGAIVPQYENSWSLGGTSPTPSRARWQSNRIAQTGCARSISCMPPAR